MPSRPTVEAFVKLVEAGDYVGAIEQFYAPDASTRENDAITPRSLATRASPKSAG